MPFLYIGIAKFRKGFWERRIVDHTGIDFDYYDENADDAGLSHPQSLTSRTRTPDSCRNMGIAVAYRGIAIVSTLEGAYASLARQISTAADNYFRLRNVNIYMLNADSVPGIHELTDASHYDNHVYAANFVPFTAVVKYLEVPVVGRKKMKRMRYMEGVRDFLNGTGVR